MSKTGEGEQAFVQKRAGWDNFGVNPIHSFIYTPYILATWLYPGQDRTTTRPQNMKRPDSGSAAPHNLGAAAVKPMPPFQKLVDPRIAELGALWGGGRARAFLGCVWLAQLGRGICTSTAISASRMGRQLLLPPPPSQLRVTLDHLSFPDKHLMHTTLVVSGRKQYPRTSFLASYGHLKKEVATICIPYLLARGSLGLSRMVSSIIANIPVSTRHDLGLVAVDISSSHQHEWPRGFSPSCGDQWIDLPLKLGASFWLAPPVFGGSTSVPRETLTIRTTRQTKTDRLRSLSGPSATSGQGMGSQSVAFRRMCRNPSIPWYAPDVSITGRADIHAMPEIYSVLRTRLEDDPKSKEWMHRPFSAGRTVAAGSYRGSDPVTRKISHQDNKLQTGRVSIPGCVDRGEDLPSFGVEKAEETVNNSCKGWMNGVYVLVLLIPRAPGILPGPLEWIPPSRLSLGSGLSHHDQRQSDSIVRWGFMQSGCEETGKTER
ncbi:hypothetical protein An02g03810 [Aspergillus niger]|uniref:Uncharacterized protein n=2 Tax=Aspergillus niger TaxID=5061 RepID=A2QCJ7_ASPNC|nr:hypothetical protein An02g03810 [Aspergillus niger]CAL00595.1 hypothetical protein An02g03810 [Aspergillus niger]